MPALQLPHLRPHHFDLIEAGTITNMDIAYGSANPVTLDGTITAPVPPLPAPPLRTTQDRARVLPSPARVKERGYRLAAFLWSGDLVVAGLAIAGGLGLRAWQRGTGAEFLTSLSTITSAPMIWIFAGGALFSWIMVALKTYDVGNLYRLHVWAMNAVKALGLWLVVMLAVVGLFKSLDFAPRAGLVYSVAALGLLQLLWRLLAYAFLMQPRVRDAATHRIIMVGWNEKAARLRMALRNDAAQLGEIIGCVPAPDSRFTVKPPGDLAVLGGYADLTSAAREYDATAVILADVSSPPREVEDLIGLCQREMLDFQMVPAFFPALGAGLQVKLVNGVPLLGVSRLPLDRLINRLIKRTTDIVGALVGLALATPVMAVFAVLVYLESPGPVLYRQFRTSRCGRGFYIYKIRSMRLDAEAATGAVWAKENDPRQLKIGTLMRRWDIDELPQFWNVLVGDMSLVGPRPERPELIARFKEEIPNYNFRHGIRAGLTGWAQIHGYRGDTDLRKRIEHDLYYLENWNPMLDLYCVLATVFRRRWTS
jgi:exopolysaccharide biosynthesis polyprenyl glycosylphosphotransferase